MTVCDSRTAYARAVDFPYAHVVKLGTGDLSANHIAQLDCAVVMHHNLTLDAAALKAIQAHPLAYVALLAPVLSGAVRCE